MRIKLAQCLSVWVLAVTVCTAAAQTAPNSRPSTEPPGNTEAEHHWFLPSAASVSRKDAKPLTPAQKFEAFAQSATSPFNFAGLAAQAGVSQAADTFPEYGQGAEGYGKRYAAAFTNSTTHNFFSNFIFPVLLKEDPRYFRSGSGSSGHRTGYAIKQEFVGFKDDGRRTFNFSKILGALASGAISNSYYPENDRGVALTFRNAGISIGFGTANGILKEFWPDISRKVFKKNSKPSK